MYYPHPNESIGSFDCVVLSRFYSGLLYRFEYPLKPLVEFTEFVDLVGYCLAKVEKISGRAETRENSAATSRT